MEQFNRKDETRHVFQLLSQIRLVFQAGLITRPCFLWFLLH